VQPVGGMDVEDADVGIPSDDPPYVPPFAGPLRGPRRRGSPARAARRAAPGHHPLATQVNLELTDLRGEPFIGYPQLTALLDPPGSHQRLPSGRVHSADPPGGRRDLQPGCPGRCRAGSSAGTGFGQASAHQRSHPPAAPGTGPGHRHARRCLQGRPGFAPDPRLPLWSSPG
jgi:hypothetical protein